MKQKSCEPLNQPTRASNVRTSQKFWSSGTCSSSHRGALLHSRAQCSKNVQRCKKQRTICPLRARRRSHFARARLLNFGECTSLLRRPQLIRRRRPTHAQELEALLRSRVPLSSSRRATSRARSSCSSSLAPRLAAAHTPVFQWTVTEGLRRLDVNLGGAQQHNAEPAAVLKSVRASTDRRHLRAARLPSVPRRSGARAAAEGHLSGLRPHAAHDRADQPRSRAAARAGAPRGALQPGVPGPRRAPRRSSRRVAADWTRTNGQQACKHRPQVARAADREPRRPVASATPSGWRAKRSSTTARCCRATCRR